MKLARHQPKLDAKELQQAFSVEEALSINLAALQK